MAKLFTPLAPNVPIVDEDGNPTPYFQRIMQELSDAMISESIADDLAALTLDDLSDVDTVTSPPNDGDSLIWDDGNSEWVPGDATSGGVQSFPILAGAMTARASNGAAAGSSEMATNKNMLVTLDFDAAAIEYAQFMFPMPKSWDEGTVTAQFIWTAASGSGDVIWGIQGVAISEADPFDAAFGTAQTVTDTLTTANDNHTTSFTSPITIGGTPAEGDMVCFQVYRDATNGSDTLNGVDAKLIALRLNITTNAGDDS